MHRQSAVLFFNFILGATICVTISVNEMLILTISQEFLPQYLSDARECDIPAVSHSGSRSPWL